MANKMAKKTKIILAIILALCLIIALVIGGTAIYHHNQQVQKEKEAQRIKKLQDKAKLNKESLDLDIGKTFQLKLENTEAKVTWSSANKAVATVSEKGLVKAIVNGDTVITATYLKKKYDVKVKVNAPAQTVTTDLNSGAKEVFLTFDDGPSVNTAKILDILKQNNVKATFFVTAEDQSNKSMLKREIEEGHAVGAHSYTHKYSIYSSEQTYFDDLNKIEEYIKSVTGKTTKLVRFPGGSSNTVSRKYCQGIMTKLSQDLTAKGYQYYDWNVSSGDAEWPTPGAAKIVYNATSTKHNKIIVLMHDAAAKKTTVEALPQIIQFYKNNGYTFKTLENANIECHHHINN